MQFLYRQFNVFACLKCQKDNQAYITVPVSFTHEQIAAIFVYLYIEKIHLTLLNLYSSL